MKKIIHLVPYDGVGGVETAARSLPGGVYENIVFSKYYIIRKHDPIISGTDRHGPPMSENDPRAYFQAVRQIMQKKPDLLVASLWRSCIVLIIMKLLRPRLKMVTFLHLASDVHWPDKILNRVAMQLSHEIWADSTTTLELRVPTALRSRGRVISFVTSLMPKPKPRSPQPRFVFWGRLHAQKGISRAINIFFELHKMLPDAQFNIIGPDGGELKQLGQQVDKLGLSSAVKFLGSMEQEQVFNVARESSFYLQASVQEGMAMSVVEAMQLGLVPIVTPVGEIVCYCRDGENAILVVDDAKVTESVINLLNEQKLYLTYAQNAVATWEGQPLYRDDVLAACRHLVGEASECAA